jgi:hypothetical protein
VVPPVKLADHWLFAAIVLHGIEKPDRVRDRGRLGHDPRDE